MGREVTVLVALVVVYVIIASQVESSQDVLAKIFWKTATARPPMLIVFAVAGWGVVVEVARRVGMRVELVIGPASPLPLWTQVRSAVGLLDGILALRLVPFVAEATGRRVATWSLACDVAAHALCLGVLLYPPSRLFVASENLAPERAAAHRKYAHTLAFETAHARDSLASTIWDSFLAPFAPVTFWHVLVADYATSMAKALGDAHVTACVALNTLADSYSRPPHHSAWWEERRGPCASSVLNASAIALPFWCRLFQCCAVYRKTREPKNLWNAAKYATAFPLVYAGYLQKQPGGGSRAFFVLAAICQSSATFAWDVLMDWGVFDRKKGGALCGAFDPSKTRDSLVFSRAATVNAYALLILFDFALRFVWTLAVFGNAPTRGAGMFAFELVELLRRTVWALFRIEWEYVVHDHPIARQVERIDDEEDKGDDDDDDDDDTKALLEEEIAKQKELDVLGDDGPRLTSV
ncbi:hypothetical protein CTAYLR_001796 [Chrysophaeum taylorii]|uniref:EXS domain-containing protein n=1 Tax=Chrysophaeum taylorii TaxID=2483200 RepID=A0AAD7XMI5_9STRA|nr:hypothetical protein CTAYLR_001796 [Chrysophaeum taylorii]